MNPVYGDRAMKTAALILISILMISINSCSSTKGFKPKGSITVLTRNALTSYYEDSESNIRGFEYELVQSFAEEYDLKVKYEVLYTVSEIIDELKEGGADFAAAGLTVTENREKDLIFGPSYLDIDQQVVCSKPKRIKTAGDLAKLKIGVIDSSSYLENLIELKKQNPDIAWEVYQDKSTEELIKMVWDGELECTIADSTIVNMEKRFLPELKVVFSIKKKDKIAWAFPKGSKSMLPYIKKWFEKINNTGKLRTLKDKYFSYINISDSYDIQVFRKRLKSRLPKYEKMIRKAAKEFGLDWKMLAAISYQESHWDPKAESPTGVRGFMMLTKATAEAMGVSNRLDTEQSIFGGTRYLVKMKKRVPGYISDNEKLWFALAAYNVGFLHLKDARKVAVELDLNPNRWADVKKSLPYLSNPRYYRHLRHGYARGTEPVVYVQRIRNYYDLIAKKARN